MTATCPLSPPAGGAERVRERFSDVRSDGLLVEVGDHLAALSHVDDIALGHSPPGLRALSASSVIGVEHSDGVGGRATVEP